MTKQVVLVTGNCVCKHWKWLDGWMPCSLCEREERARQESQPTKEELRDERQTQH
jgi:hypothetical protein